MEVRVHACFLCRVLIRVSAPMLVVLKDRGQTLRFYSFKNPQMRVNAEILYEFLKEERWQDKEPWKSAYSPGGER